MSDLERIKDLFGDIGVDCAEWNGFMPEADDKALILSVGGGHLLFDLSGRFLGTLSDERGHWTPRQQKGLDHG